MKKSPSQLEYSDIVNKIDEHLKDAQNYRNQWSIRSYVNQAFYEGRHELMFNERTRAFETLPVSDGNRYAIGKIRKIVRGVRNTVLRNDPRWHATTGWEMNATDDEIGAAYALLNSVYKRCHIKDKLKDILTHSSLKTTGWMFVGFDQDKDDFDVFVEDPYNIYTSPDGRMEGPVFVGSYMIRAIAKSLNEIKSNPLYKNWPAKGELDDLTTTMSQADSQELDQLKANDYVIPTGKNGMCIVHEFYSLQKKQSDGIDELTVPQEDQLYEKDEYRVRIITKVGNVVIRDEMTEYRNFPFIGYQMERYCGQIYHPSWVEPLIALNRALDDGYTNRAEFLEMFAKGRWLNRKNNKMSVIRSKNGQIIEYEGTAPEYLQPWTLPNEVNIHMNDTERYMEDIGGLHSETLGRLSGSANSGVAIAQLQAADLNNIAEPVDNLKSFMEELAYRILDLASRNVSLRIVTDEEGDAKRIIGSEMKKEVEGEMGEMESKPIEIKPLRNVEVEIVPGSAFSDLQARTDLMELKQAGLPIPDTAILNAYKLGNTAAMIRKFQEEEEEKQEQADGVDGLEAQQANLENKKLVEWLPISPQDGENHEVHISIHSALLANYPEGDPRTQALMDHIKSTEALMNGGMQWATPQQAQEAMPEAEMQIDIPEPTE